MARLKNATPASIVKVPGGKADPWKGYFKLKQKLPRTGMD
jgi:hypothetical protein